MSSIRATNKGFNVYPLQPNAGLVFKIGVLTKSRPTEQRWKMTTSRTESFVLDTTLANYAETLPEFLTSVWNYATSERNLTDTADITLTYAVQLENTTAPTPSAGSWVQNKQHYDGRLTDEEFSSLEVLQVKLEQVTELIKKHAKY